MSIITYKKWSDVTGNSIKNLTHKHPLPYLWKIAYLTSYDERTIEETPLLIHSKDFIRMSNREDFGFVAIFKDHVVISFRGTDGGPAWISNFDPFPLREDAYRGKYLKDGPWGKGCIHDGFYTGWSFFKPAIDKLIQAHNINYEITPIFVTGHSRGGALAELCARHLAKNRGIPTSVITFGSPAPGTKTYRDQFRLLPINGTWVRNNWDIVTFLPPPAFGFKHGCANLLWLNKGSAIRRIFPWSRIRDHYYISYDKPIMAKAQKT